MVHHQDSENIKYKIRVKVETQQSISYCLKAINKPPTLPWRPMDLQLLCD